MWVKLGNESFNLNKGGSRMNLVKCFKPSSNNIFGFEMVISRDTSSGDFNMRASVQSIILSNVIEKI